MMRNTDIAQLTLFSSKGHDDLARSLGIGSRYFWDLKKENPDKNPSSILIKNIRAEFRLMKIPASKDIGPHIEWLRYAVANQDSENLDEVLDQINCAITGDLNPIFALHWLKGIVYVRKSVRSDGGYYPEHLRSASAAFNLMGSTAATSFWKAIAHNNLIGAEYLFSRYIIGDGKVPPIDQLMRMHSEYRKLANELAWSSTWRDCLDYSTLIGDSSLVEEDFTSFLRACGNKPGWAINTVLQALEGYDFLCTQEYYLEWVINTKLETKQ